MRFFRRDKSKAVDEEIINLVRKFYKASWEEDHDAFNAIIHSKKHIPLKTPPVTFLFEPVRYEIRAQFGGYIIACFHSKLLKTSKDGKVTESPIPITSVEIWEFRPEESTGAWKVWDRRFRGHANTEVHSDCGQVDGGQVPPEWLSSLFTTL